MVGPCAQEDSNNCVLLDNSDGECTDTARQSAENQYKHRKPKWWNHLSRKGTKAQRRAINDMKDYSLPRVQYGQFIDWDSVFRRDETNFQSIWLEIGFGAGDNLLQLAEQYPEKYFVGAEMHQPGVGKIMQKIKYAIENKSFWKGSFLYPTQIDPKIKQSPSDTSDSIHTCRSNNKEDGAVENPYSNLRIYLGDGVQLLSTIPSGTLEAVLVTNPDPFPTNDEKEWRLFQIHTLREMRRVLIPSGRLYLATDHEGFYSWSHEVIDAANKQDEIFRTIDPQPSRYLWLPVVSEYEQKGLENGRKPHLSCWEAA